MKRIFIALIIILFSTSVFSQGELYIKSKRQSRNKIITTLAIQAGSVAINAIGDGLLDKGRYEGDQSLMVYGHALRAASIGTMLTIPLVIDSKKDLLPFIGSYLFIRAATFDPVYNAVRGVPWNYHGDTSIWDKGWNEVNMPPLGEVWVRSWSFAIGVAIQINYH
jgi:hypothetical protein